jgi:hypothetical protein
MCKKIFSFILISFIPLITLAQGESCDGTDPLDPCATPLDTWVIALVVIVGVLATIHLYRKQKSFQA